LLLLLAFAPLAVAQETTGSIQGTVKDPQGAVIPGATVEVSSPALIGRKTAVTDSGGSYRFDLLPPGIYSISVNATGFGPQTQSNLELTTGALPIVNFTVQVGGVSQEISVSAQAATIDVSLSKVQTSVTQDVLIAIPKLRSFQSVIPFAPGARQEPLQGARENRLNGFQIDGATDSENVYMIDGINATDIGTGGVGKDFQSDFIQEVQVKSGGFEAEFGGALGGVINAIPKRGSNAWHGELKGYFQTASLNANDPCGSGFTSSLNPAFFRAFSSPSGYFGVTCGLRTDPTTALNTTTRVDAVPEYFVPKKDSRHVIEPGYELGGALYRDKLWIFSSYVPTLDTIQREVNFKCPTTNLACTYSGPRRFGQTMNQHNAYNRLDYGVTNSLRLYGSWNYAYTRTIGQLPAPDSERGQVNTGATIDPTTLRADQAVVMPLSIYSVGGDWNPTSKLLLTARYGYFFKNFSTRGTPSGIRYVYDNALNANTRDINGNPFPANSPAPQAGSAFSNIPSNFAYLYDAFKRKTFNADAAYFLRGAGGSHNFKLGYFWQGQRNDVQRTASTSVVTLFWGLQYQPVTSTAACDPIRATSNGLCQGQYGYFHVGSTTVSNTGFSNATANALYLQDAWTVGNTGLTLNLGVRFDEETLPPFDKRRFPTVHFGWGDKIAPRLGGAYDLLHNGKVKLFASYGKFFDITKMDLPRGSFGSDYWHECVYALDTVDMFSIQPTLTTGAGCPPSGPAPGVNARFIENVDFRATKADSRDPAVQANMKSISSHDVMVGTEFAITRKLIIEGRYTNKRLDQTIEDMSITDSLGFYIGNPGTGYADILHRPVVIPVNGVDTLISTPFCAECPSVVKPTRKYDALELRLTHRSTGRWLISGSYTYESLRGNYSGLTDTDPTDANGGRHNPNHGRAFDIPTMTYLPSGQVDNGQLASSRPHTGKLWGSYDLPWLGQVTKIGFSQILYQGTPISSCLPVVGTSSACQWAEGRGNFAQLGRDASGNITKTGVINDARTDALLQTDLSLRHEIRVNKNNENHKLVIEGNGYNLFNQHASTSFYQFVIPTNVINPGRVPRFPGDAGTDFGKLMNGYNYIDALNGTGAFSGNVSGTSTRIQSPLTLASRYGLPQTFQISRQFRFAVRFMF
jgi:Carboxypeptidase regulatory-like domain/TonB-dependent Receptor Plug Domain